MAFSAKSRSIRKMTHHYRHISLKTLAIASSFTLASFIGQGHKGLNLWDEGFLWYGVQRVLMGEVPIRDFMAYDPGRYYWSAALMGLFGDNGIVSLRAAAALFQLFGLFAGLSLLSRSIDDKKIGYLPFLLLSALTLTAWMFPRHKVFDISLSIGLIAIVSFLVEKPSARRYFIAGCGVGLVAVFGRNHGIYGVVGSLGAMLWLAINRTDQTGFGQGLLLWSAGVAAGFAPILLLALIVPGFAEAFWDSIRFLFEIKSTNLPVSVPWPWKVNFAAPIGDVVSGVLVGMFFMATLVFGSVGMVWLINRRIRERFVPPTLVGATFLSLPYAHYAFSRADTGHLAQGIFPLLIGCLVLLSAQTPGIKWPLAAALCAASLWAVHGFRPGWQCIASQRCVDVEIMNDRLQVDQATADDVDLLKQLVHDYAPAHENFVVTPLWPGAYALFGQQSPMWANYTIFPRSREFQQREIERIKKAKPKFLLVLDIAVDGRDDLRFHNTLPLLYRFIVSNYTQSDRKMKNPDYLLFVDNAFLSK